MRDVAWWAIVLRQAGLVGPDAACLVGSESSMSGKRSEEVEIAAKEWGRAVDASVKGARSPLFSGMPHQHLLLHSKPLLRRRGVELFNEEGFNAVRASGLKRPVLERACPSARQSDLKSQPRPALARVKLARRIATCCICCSVVSKTGSQ